MNPVKQKKTSLEKVKNVSHLLERSQSKTSNTIILIDDEILSPNRKGCTITKKQEF